MIFRHLHHLSHPFRLGIHCLSVNTVHMRLFYAVHFYCPTGLAQIIYLNSDNSMIGSRTPVLY